MADIAPIPTQNQSQIAQEAAVIAKQQQDIAAQQAAYKTQQAKLAEIQEQYVPKVAPSGYVNIAYEPQYKQQYAKAQETYKQQASAVESYNKAIPGYQEKVEQAKIEIAKLPQTPKSQEDIILAESLYDKGFISKSDLQSYKETAQKNIQAQKDYEVAKTEISKLSTTPKSIEDIAFAESLYGKGFISQSDFFSYKDIAQKNIEDIQKNERIKDIIDEFNSPTVSKTGAGILPVSLTNDPEDIYLSQMEITTKYKSELPQDVYDNLFGIAQKNIQAQREYDYLTGAKSFPIYQISEHERYPTYQKTYEVVGTGKEFKSPGEASQFVVSELLGIPARIGEAVDIPGYTRQLLGLPGNVKSAQDLSREYWQQKDAQQAAAKLAYLESPTAMWGTYDPVSGKATGNLEAYAKAFQTQFGRMPTAIEQSVVLTPNTPQQLQLKSQMLTSPTATFMSPVGQIFSPSSTPPPETKEIGKPTDLGFYSKESAKLVQLSGLTLKPEGGEQFKFAPAPGISVLGYTSEQRAVERPLLEKYGAAYDINKLEPKEVETLVGAGILKYEQPTKSVDTKISGEELVNINNEILLSESEMKVYRDSIKSQSTIYNQKFGTTVSTLPKSEIEKNAYIAAIGLDKYNKATDIINKRIEDKLYNIGAGLSGAERDIYGFSSFETAGKLYTGMFTDIFATVGLKTKEEQTKARSDFLVSIGAAKTGYEGKSIPEAVLKYGLESPLTAMIPIGAAFKVGGVAGKYGLTQVAKTVGTETLSGRGALATAKWGETAIGLGFLGAAGVDIVSSSKSVPEFLGKTTTLAISFPGAIFGYKGTEFIGKLHSGKGIKTQYDEFNIFATGRKLKEPSIFRTPEIFKGIEEASGIKSFKEVLPEIPKLEGSSRIGDLKAAREVVVEGLKPIGKEYTKISEEFNRQISLPSLQQAKVTAGREQFFEPLSKIISEPSLQIERQIAAREASSQIFGKFNIGLEKFKGITTGLSRTLNEPSLQVMRQVEAKQLIKEIEPSSRIHDLIAAKETTKDIYKQIVEETKHLKKKAQVELSQPTIRKEAISSVRSLFGDYKLGVKKELVQPTRGRVALKEAKNLLGEYGSEFVSAYESPLGRYKPEIKTGINIDIINKRPKLYTKYYGKVESSTLETPISPSEYFGSITRSRFLTEGDIQGTDKIFGGLPSSKYLKFKDKYKKYNKEPDFMTGDLRIQDIKPRSFYMQKETVSPKLVEESKPLTARQKELIRLNKEGRSWESKSMTGDLLVKDIKPRSFYMQKETVSPKLVEESNIISKTEEPTFVTINKKGRRVIDIGKMWELENKKSIGGIQDTGTGQALMLEMKPQLKQSQILEQKSSLEIEGINYGRAAKSKLESQRKSIEESINTEKQSQTTRREEPIPKITTISKPKGQKPHSILILPLLGQKQEQREQNIDKILTAQIIPKQIQIQKSKTTQFQKQEQLQKQIQKEFQEQKFVQIPELIYSSFQEQVPKLTQKQIQEQLQEFVKIQKQEQLQKQIQREVPMQKPVRIEREEYFLKSLKKQKDEIGEREPKDKFGYKYKPRISPIFERGAEKLFEDGEDILGLPKKTKTIKLDKKSKSKKKSKDFWEM